jgi:hypothetical protein
MKWVNSIPSVWLAIKRNTPPNRETRSQKEAGMVLKSVIARMEAFDWILVAILGACVVGGLAYAVFNVSG